MITNKTYQRHKKKTSIFPLEDEYLNTAFRDFVNRTDKICGVLSKRGMGVGGFPS